MKASSYVLGAALTLAVLSPAAASAATVYSNDFSNGLGGFTTTGALRTDNGETYIGNLTQGARASITIDTTGYQNLKLSFDLYAVLSLDGNVSPGPDPFRVTSNGDGTFFDYTFANYGGKPQSFGGQGLPAGNYASRTGSSGTNLLGFGSGDFGDTEYSLSNISVSAVGNLLTLTFVGDSDQGAGDEFYGFDNVSITGDLVATGAVPEPASWAMMIMGFGMTGVGLRHRQRRMMLRYS